MPNCKIMSTYLLYYFEIYVDIVVGTRTKWTTGEWNMWKMCRGALESRVLLRRFGTEKIYNRNVDRKFKFWYTRDSTGNIYSKCKMIYLYLFDTANLVFNQFSLAIVFYCIKSRILSLMYWMHWGLLFIDTIDTKFASKVIKLHCKQNVRNFNEKITH